MNSIRLRLKALFIVVTTTALVAFAAYDQVLLYRQVEAQFAELKADVVTRLQQNLADPVWVLDQGVIAAKLEAALIPPDVRAVYLFGPDKSGLLHGVARNLAGQPVLSLSQEGQRGTIVEADVFPPTQVDERRRKLSTGKLVVVFSRDRLEQTLWDALYRRIVEVLTVNLLLIVLLTLSLRLVFNPLEDLRAALFKLSANEGEDLEALPRSKYTEFDAVIVGFNRTLDKLKEVIVRRREAESSALAAAKATEEALARVKEAQEALLQKNRELEVLTITDRLTGIANRLRLDRVLEEEMNRFQRYGGNFSLVLIDIDHFKAVNDHHGHQVGDLVLTTVSRCLSDETRSADVPGRWGGEEFLIVCRDTPLEGATALADKIRRTIESCTFPVVQHMTASFGVTTARPGDSSHQMIARADSALYRSKAEGRNRVSVAD